MSDLFRKLNTLVRAQIDSVLEDDLNLPTRRRSRQPIDPNSKDADKIIAKMRKEIDEALTHQEALQAKIDGLDVNATILNQRIDEALLAHQEEQARHLAGRLKQLDQQITIAQSELDLHRQKTAALMDDVNLLEGLVAEARAQQKEMPSAAPSQPVTIPVSIEPEFDDPTLETPDAPPVKSKPIVVSIAVEPDNNVTEEHEAHAPPETPKSVPQKPQPDDDQDNIAARRARLAAPPTSKEE